MPISLPFSKVIFIFEDVDACGDVVQKRAPGKAPAAAPAPLPVTTTELTLTCDPAGSFGRRGSSKATAVIKSIDDGDGSFSPRLQAVADVETLPDTGDANGVTPVDAGDDGRVTAPSSSVHLVTRQASAPPPGGGGSMHESAFDERTAAAVAAYEESEGARGGGGVMEGPVRRGGPTGAWLKRGGDDALNLAGGCGCCAAVGWAVGVGVEGAAYGGVATACCAQQQQQQQQWRVHIHTHPLHPPSPLQTCTPQVSSTCSTAWWTRPGG